MLTCAVPRLAVRLAAAVELPKEGGTSTRFPVSILALTRHPVTHWFWGRIVHDMTGLRLPKPTVPLDFCHDPSDVVGYADRFDVSSGDLVVSGALVSVDGRDRAHEIASKGKEGVPWEASIFFDENNYVIEEVGQGMTVQVNGAAFTGPGTVVRQWELRGVAICPYGTDAGTTVSFGSRLPKDVTVRLMSRPPLARDLEAKDMEPGTATFAAALSLPGRGRETPVNGKPQMSPGLARFAASLKLPGK